MNNINFDLVYKKLENVDLPCIQQHEGQIIPLSESVQAYTKSEVLKIIREDIIDYGRNFYEKMVIENNSLTKRINM